MADVPPIVKELAKKVALTRVHLIRGQFEFLGITKGDRPEEIKYGIQAAGIRSPDTANAIRVMVGVRAILRVTGGRDAAQVTCDYSLDYTTTDPASYERLSNADLLDFASWNGVYNAWPFIREFCRDVTGRMPLPTPILLPVLTSPGDMETRAAQSWGDYGGLQPAAPLPSKSGHK
jgi:hypothetical protein